MAQQTAISWLREKLKETYDKEGKLPLAYTLHLVKQAKQMEPVEERDNMVRLLRWVLKHYSTGTDIEGFFMWENPRGEELDSMQVVDHYLKENK